MTAALLGQVNRVLLVLVGHKDSVFTPREGKQEGEEIREIVFGSKM